MILNGKKLKRFPFSDSRGHYGESGQLHIAEDIMGTRFLVKSKPADVANEYVAHRLGKIIGVPTSDAVLIEDRGSIDVGIVFEKDFKRANFNDFIGQEHYLDDSPYIADLMAYLSFRNLIVLEDNPQLAFAGNRLISFDYAESFYMTNSVYGALNLTGNYDLPVSVFKDHLFLQSGYQYALEILKRPGSDSLLDAFLDPIFKFQESDLEPILCDLQSVFPKVISSFYRECFNAINDEINKLKE